MAVDLQYPSKTRVRRRFAKLLAYIGHDHISCCHLSKEICEKRIAHYDVSKLSTLAMLSPIEKPSENADGPASRRHTIDSPPFFDRLAQRFKL